MTKVEEELRGMNVAVIGGEPMVRRSIERTLQAAGLFRITLIDDPADLGGMVEPDLVFLELRSARGDGPSALEVLRTALPLLRHVPVLAYSEDQSTASRQRALELGANDFIGMPCEPVEIALRVRNFLRTRKLYQELEGYSLDLENKVRRRTHDLVEAAEDCLLRFARASEYRDDDTGEHTVRVGLVSSRIAENLGLEMEEVEMIRRAAPLHDIGKIGIPDTILLKPGKLTEEETAVMRSHVKIGSSLLAGSSSKLMTMAETIAHTHHERWDGTGYAMGLSGEQIPLCGRIVAVADVYDALVHDRPYKQAWPKEKAIEEIRCQSGAHFDPRVVDAFMRYVEQTEPSVTV